MRADYLKRATSDLSRHARLRILDAGGGSGVHSFYLAGKLPRACIVAVDKDQQNIANCNSIRRRLGLENIEFVSVDLPSCRSNWRFDRIVCFDVLEHIKDDKQVLQNFSHWLLEGGRLILHTPNKHQKHYCRPAEEYRRQQLEPQGGEHVRHGYTAREIASLLSETGLKTVEMHYTFGKSGTLAVDLDCLFWMRGHRFLRVFLFPLLTLLTRVDYLFSGAQGNGLLVVAERQKRAAG